MLINMRKFGGKWVLGIFMGLIMASFAFWGIGDVIRGIVSRSVLAVAVVGDVEISNPEIRREFSLQVARLQPYFGNQLDSTQAVQLGVLDQTINVLLTRTLYDLEAERVGLAVSRTMLEDDIRTSPLFQNAQGQFDANLFASFLAAQRLSEQGYLAIRRDEIQRAQLASAVTGAVRSPASLVDTFYRYNQERRVAEYFVLENQLLDDGLVPPAGELAAFHQANAADFTAPEYRAVTFIHLTPEDILEEIAVSDEEIETEYADRRFEFTQPERRQLEQIVAPDEAAARAIHEQLVTGRDFVTVAIEMTGADAADVSLGAVARGDLFGDMADAIFGLDVGTVSTPVESAFGWHIFRVTAIEPAAVQPLDAVRESLTQDIALRRAADALYDFANQLDDEFAGGATIEEAADRLSLRLIRVEAVDALGHGRDEQPVADLPPGPAFLTTAFTTARGETSLLVATEHGSEFVLRVDRITEPALRLLDDVRAAVTEAWRAERSEMLTRETAEALAERIAAAGGFAEGASEHGVVVTVSDPVRRDGDGAGEVLSNELVAALFTLRPHDAVAGSTRDGSGQVVLRLAQVIDADPAADAVALAEQRDSMRAGIASDLMDQYRAYLEQRYPVTVNRRALEALF